MAKNSVMPDKYDSAGNWSDYLLQFDICSQLNGWKEDQRCLFLGLCLTGKAFTAYKELADDVKKNYAALTEALGHKFAPAERVLVEKLKFSTRQWVTGEPLADLAADIRAQATKAYPALSMAGQEELALDRFVDALPCAIRTLVRQRVPTDMATALSVAMHQEAILEVEKRQTVNAATLQGNGSAVTQQLEAVLQQNTAAMNAMVAMMQKLVSNASTSNPTAPATSQPRDNRGRREPPTCWTCGQVGHRQASCTTYVNQHPQQTPGNGRGPVQ
jgi:Zinc knuckle